MLTHRISVNLKRKRKRVKKNCFSSVAVNPATPRKNSRSSLGTTDLGELVDDSAHRRYPFHRKECRLVTTSDSDKIQLWKESNLLTQSILLSHYICRFEHFCSVYIVSNFEENIEFIINLYMA